ncbi:MAG: hypothetical protein WAW31_02340, partial [Smithella sp.]
QNGRPFGPDQRNDVVVKTFLISVLILNDFFLVFTANPLSRANAPLPIAFAKRGLQNFYKWDLSQSLDYEAYVLELTLKMQDFKEGFTAFLEKRDPIFKGE